MIFEPGHLDLNDLADHIEATRPKECVEAVRCARSHTWETVYYAPIEFGYQLLVEYLDVLGPAFRGGTIKRMGDSPFWAARTWMTVKGLTDEEYHFLFARAQLKDKFVERVLDGSLEPGSRAIV
jgi:hypothetical protein